MRHQSEISNLLHRIFDENAIEGGAICEQLEDVKYCTAHKMNPLNGEGERSNWEKAQRKAERVVEKSETFTPANMKKFQEMVNRYLSEHPKARLYEGLTEVERFAVRRFYYYNLLQ